MYKSILAIAAVAALLGTAGAVAGAGQSLSEYLNRCNSDPQTCTMVAYSLIENGSKVRYICVPKTVSLDDAAARQVAWLKERVQNNPRFGNENATDAQWTAAEALWPCAKG